MSSDGEDVDGEGQVCKGISNSEQDYIQERKEEGRRVSSV